MCWSRETQNNRCHCDRKGYDESPGRVSDGELHRAKSLEKMPKGPA
jgi:hypothetical protein